MTAAEEAVTLQSQLKRYDEARTAYAAANGDDGASIRDYEDWEDVQLDVVDEFAERTRLTVHPGLWNIEALQSEDELKRELELTCMTCREHLCDIEPSDIFTVIMITAFEHIKERHLAPEGEEDHR